jgi:benzoyl-CoA reductase/2-hydroxyglutaryl-CoA dehydratase subunit BcrC/BadD/HgdB
MEKDEAKAMGEAILKKPIAATKEMKKIMAHHFYELDEAVKSKKQKVAWCTSVGPAEILRAMGFLVYYPENHGAMLGATRTAMDCIPLANRIGYSPDICSYTTSDIGAYLKGETPIAKAYPGITCIPKPDVLAYNTNQCRDVLDWFSFYGREWKLPVIGISTPLSVGEMTKEYIADVSGQMRALIKPLEEISGQKFDMDRLKRVLALSLEATKLWKACLFAASAIPSPTTFFDSTIHMGPAVVLRGTEEAVAYYKLLLAELKERVKDKVAAVEGEKYRIYWDGMPIWGKLREHSDLFASLKTSIVASTYCNSWIFEAFDPEDPFDSMARAYTELFIVRTDEVKERYITEMLKTFSCDGIIYHDSKTCPNNSNARYGMPQRLTKRTGIPHLILQGDLNDLRLFSEEQAKTNIEAFVEGIEEK